jgi:hypothetical protein
MGRIRQISQDVVMYSMYLPSQIGSLRATLPSAAHLSASSDAANFEEPLVSATFSMFCSHLRWSQHHQLEKISTLSAVSDSATLLWSPIFLLTSDCNSTALHLCLCGRQIIVSTGMLFLKHTLYYLTQLQYCSRRIVAANMSSGSGPGSAPVMSEPWRISKATGI